MTKREQYIAKAKTKLDNLETELTKLEARAEDAKGDAKQAIESEINEIKQSKSSLEGKIHELRSASDAAWSDLKVGADHAWKVLSKSVESAAQRFR